MSATDPRALLDGLSSARVLAAMSPQLPDRLVRDVLTEARRRGVELTLLVADLAGTWAFLDGHSEEDLVAGRLRVVVVAGSVPLRLARYVEHLPVSLWEADRLLRSGALAVDIFLARVQAPGSWGSMVGFSPSALTAAERIGFEVAPPGPIHDGAELDLGRADVLVSTGDIPTASDSRTGTSTQQRIADLTAALVPDGATLQLGVGAIPAGLTARLGRRHELGLHSGILPGSVQSLIASGAATGARKTRQVGRHVATGLIGGDPSAWGRRVLLLPISFTHDPRELLAQHEFWALNSAYEVDITGQVNAEFLHLQRITSGGGQADFAKAAHAGTGASVISLPSRTPSGAPRIVAQLDCPVTTPATDVDIVVTEHGVAQLNGRTVRERAAALIAVAHPDDRASLARAVHAPHRRFA